MGTQPLAYLYLSQIPYTGLELGPTGTVIYWSALVVFALAFAYLILFVVAPFVYRFAHDFGSSISATVNSQESRSVASNHVMMAVPPASSKIETSPESERGYSTYEGFKSFAHNGALSIDDIVKGLSRKSLAPVVERTEEQTPNVEPAYENIKPVHDNVGQLQLMAPSQVRYRRISVSLSMLG